jgi:hypothetical protein
MANQLDSFSPNEIRDAANKVIQVIQSKVIRNPDSLILLGYMALIAHSGDPNLTQIVPNIIAAGLYNLIALVIRGKAADQEISDNIEGLQLTLQRSQAKLEREFRHLRFGLDTISQQFPDLYNQLTEYLDARLPPQENSTYPHLDLLIEPTHNQFFVGRNDIIKQILGRTSQIRFTTILGIAGSGKTDLMRELASGLKDRGMRVFWYDFKSDLFSLDSILVRLAQFVDTITGELGNLTQKIRTAGLSYTDRIRLLTNSLNENNYYLFFDAYEEANSEIGSFFSSLKQYLTNTSIFLTSQIVPNF